MRVIVDGTIYGRQRYGGINTFFNEVLPRIARYDHTRVDLLVPGQCRGVPPGPPVHWIARDFIGPRTGLSWRLDERLEPIIESFKLGVFGLWAKTRSEAVFQSTYFTSLPVSVPHVAMAYDMNHELFPELYADPQGIWLRKRYPEYLRAATRIIAISNTTRRHVEHYYGIPHELIDVVPPGVDTSRFFLDTQDDHFDRLRGGLGIERPYILFVGGRWHYKNFPLLLEAMGRLSGHTGLTLVVAGAPWDEREVAQFTSHRLFRTIRLVVHPDDDLLRLLYSFAAGFAFPSLSEGFGIPLLEAMACGAPVIASDTDVFREVAGEAAIYFNATDADALAQAIERCLDERTRAQYRERGLAQVAKYSWESTAAQTRAVYEKVLNM